jgi:hypothetical protein
LSFFAGVQGLHGRITKGQEAPAPARQRWGRYILFASSEINLLDWHFRERRQAKSNLGFLSELCGHCMVLAKKQGQPAGILLKDKQIVQEKSTSKMYGMLC